MLDKIRAYRDAARKGAAYLLDQQNPDGSLIGEGLQADVYHKAPQALLLTGHADRAGRLLEWIKSNDLQANGRLHHFDSGLALYKTNWICQGAHRMGRFDISMPVVEFILSCQAPCGGSFQTPELTQFVEPVCTSWTGVTCLYTGRLQGALRSAECIRSMVDQQPDADRFYYHMTPEGSLLTGEGAPFVDATKTEQAYYCPGIAGLFMVRLHLATGDEACLGTARELLQFQLGCAEDAFAYPTAGKSAVAAAILYAVTGDGPVRNAALCMGDYLVGQQKEEGWWCNPYDDGIITRLDHTAEFVVFLSEIAATLSAACGPSPEGE